MDLIITLDDVARVELGAESIRTLFKGNGKQVVGIGIYQQSDANTIKVADGIKKKIKEIQSSLPPGNFLEVSFDRSNYIKAAINEVYKTLCYSFNFSNYYYLFIFRKHKGFNSSCNCFTCFSNFNFFINIYI